jgi:hypothetical protein
MLALSDNQLAAVMTAAGKLPTEKRGVSLERVVARAEFESRLNCYRICRHVALSSTRADPRKISGLIQAGRFPPPWSARRWLSRRWRSVRQVQTHNVVFALPPPAHSRTHRARSTKLWWSCSSAKLSANRRSTSQLERARVRPSLRSELIAKP